MADTSAAKRDGKDFYVMRFEKQLSHLRRAQIELISTDNDDEDETDRLADIEWAAKERVLAARAPNMWAVVAKLEILLEPESSWDREIVAGVIAEAMALADIDQPVTFVPEVWLHYFQRYGGQVSRRDDQIWLSAPFEGHSANRIRELTAVQRKAVLAHLEQTIED